MNTSQNPPGVGRLVHSGQAAKQHESSFLYDIRDGRPIRHTPHFAVGNVVAPSYAKDPPQAPPTQRTNPSGASPRQSPAPRSAQHHWQNADAAQPQPGTQGKP